MTTETGTEKGKTRTPRKSKKKERPVYPWLRLLEMERERPDLHPAGETPRPGKKRGRPRNAFPRKKVHITLTEDELQTLDGLLERLAPQLRGLHRGNLVALLVFHLQEALKNVNTEDVKNLADIVKALDAQKEEVLESITGDEAPLVAERARKSSSQEG